jgi:hypothetical protein
MLTLLYFPVFFVISLGHVTSSSQLDASGRDLRHHWAEAVI